MDTQRFAPPRLNRKRSNSGSHTRDRGHAIAHYLRPLLAFTALAALAMLPMQGRVADAQAASQWYMTDTHVHSSISSDGFSDLGIISQAQALGYNAIFTTEHDGGSNYVASTGYTANHVVFEDNYAGWTKSTYGTIGSTTNALASTPHRTGNNSVHIATTSSSYGETYITTQRGPNFRGGDIILHFSVYPLRVDAGSGFDVSVSIGGDPTVSRNPTGYTTQAGVISPGKSTVLVWELGATRAPSTNPNARVLTYSLGNYVLNAWNDYTINVTAALADIPAADMPLDYTGLSQLKITAAGNNGTADAYFDSYGIDASTPESSANEFVYKTSIASQFNGSNFIIFPSYEMGSTKHSNRFDFGITQPSQFVSYPIGSDGILPTEQGGYPAQLNHPGFTITDAEAIATQDQGADFVETRDPNHVADWDGVLQQGVQVIGSWSSDAHTGLTAGKPATYMYAPSLALNDLMHAYFEGRVYNALNNFTGRTIINLNSASLEPFPARYPVYVPDTQTSTNVHFQITSGLYSSDSIIWVVNGTALPIERPTSGAYNVVKSVNLSAPSTYVRAEAQASGGTRRAMSQALFFVKVPGLPTGMSYYVTGITTPDNRNYTKNSTKGLTASSWDSTNQALALTLTDPVQSLATMVVSTTTAPQSVTVDGTLATQAATLSDFQAATTSAYYYDGSSTLYVKVLHASTTANVIITLTAQSTTATPTAMTSPTQTATSVPTGVPTNTPTPAPTNTATNTPPATPTSGSTNTATNTPVATPTGAPTAQILFADGFESGDFSFWLGSSGNGRTGSKAEVITAAAYAGTYGAHFNNLNGGFTNTGPYRAANFAVPASHIISAQSMVKINSVSGAGEIRILHLRDEARAKSVARIHYNNGVWQLNILRKDGTSANANFTTGLATGAWQLVELTYNWSGAQPVASAYLNGVLQATITDTTAGTAYNINSLYCLAYEDVPTAATDVYFDEVKVGNRYIGPAAATATPTPLPPTATSVPTNTATATVPPTDTPVIVPTDTPTNTPVVVPTDTPTSTPTDTPAPVFTDTPTNTPTNTTIVVATDTPTNTAIVVATDTPTNTPTNTPTVAPTNTPSATPTGAPTAQILFADGFESGDFSFWLGSSGNGRAGSKAEVITAAAFAGTYGAHFNNLNGGFANTGPYRAANFAVPTNHIVSAQSMVKVNSVSGAGEIRILHLRDEARAKSVARIHYNNGVWQLNVLRKDGTSVNANFTTGLATGVWQRVELTYNWSGTQAVVSAYLNGVLQASVTDTTTGSAYNVSSLYCLAYEDVPTAATDVYFDEVKVAKGYIGAP